MKNFPSLPILIIAMSTLLMASPLVAQNPLLQQMGDYKLLIRDSYGRTVEVHNMSNKQQINIAHYAPGIYWATLMLADSRSQTLRFVKSNN
jgi:hypothetical protein